ncbi:lactonase family protein [Martelella radicis]|uniref:6-phosphogluconolactonase n=1 Tax=Martelella radicis TaxID=1397476 RepID=A0A7W6KNM3_9HYPH|nr:beta-propeller fold lactonase family protein [Martelella radicis]MBB4124603.1 6-phosphogluconolactonase [Martelella radicis]
MRQRLIVCNTASADIILYHLDMDAGSICQVGRQPIPGVWGPSSAIPMAMCGDRVYLAWRGEAPAVLCFRIDPECERLDHAGTFPVPEGFCHLSVTSDGGFLLGASGSRGFSIALSADGVPEGIADIVHVGEMSHCLCEKGGVAYAASCRDDIVRQFGFDWRTGILSETGMVRFPEGSGPRHIAIAPDGAHAHVLTQEGGFVGTIAATTSSLAGTVRLVPEAVGPMGGDIVISPDGNSLFATERTTGRLFSMQIDGETAVPVISGQVSAPEYPRALYLSAEGDTLIALGFRANAGRVYAVGRVEGLTARMDFTCGTRPSWVLGQEMWAGD